MKVFVINLCKSINRLLLGSGICLIPLIALSDNVPVTVKVEVVAPIPCVINDSKLIEVNFGDITTTRIDGSNYSEDVDYSLSCIAGEMESNLLTMNIRGTTAGYDFDSHVLRTNKAGLGVAVYANDVALPINTSINFIYPNKPKLKVVPVRSSSIALSGGYFSSTATMVVDYQ